MKYFKSTGYPNNLWRTDDDGDNWWFYINTWKSYETKPHNSGGFIEITEEEAFLEIL